MALDVGQQIKAQLAAAALWFGGIGKMPSGISRSNATVEQKKGKNREITTLFLYTIAAKNRNKNSTYIRLGLGLNF